MKIKNDLVNLSIKDYEKCLHYIVNELSRNEEIEAIYQFGNINFPGISDIDLLFIVNDNCKYNKVYSEINTKIKEAPNSDYCFYHKAIVITKKQSKYLHLFHSVESLKLLSGNELKLKGNFDLPQILIWNSFFYPMIFNLMGKNKVSLRYLLLILNNAAYSIKANDSIHGTNYYHEYKALVNNLRNQCIKENIDIQEIKYVIGKAKYLINLQESLWTTQSTRHRTLFYSNKIIRFGENLKIKNIYFLNYYIFPTIYGVLYSILNDEKKFYKNSDYMNSFMYYKENMSKAMLELKLSYSDILDLFLSVNLFNTKE
ncbi:hypothetical protein [Methanosarcina sp. 2.H.A.1B.4]|uniref:hypothetical protein n=1 Tax=Methanosarcina sp. 2.H.A.1B.4 TaxID=1483600 RepID=UPI0006222D35|nr:hypothetical protein [Methanosarcina sp. 2.H.A.1B.4]KKG07374.1 hypothetical protein EO92_14975 [Methanosarcina sp. 2.H.A.1B.4]